MFRNFPGSDDVLSVADPLGRPVPATPLTFHPFITSRACRAALAVLGSCSALALGPAQAMGSQQNPGSRPDAASPTASAAYVPGRVVVGYISRPAATLVHAMAMRAGVARAGVAGAVGSLSPNAQVLKLAKGV